MTYQIFESKSNYLIKNIKGKHKFPLQLKQLAVPYRHQYRQKMVCKNDHTTYSKYVNIDFVCLKFTESIHQSFILYYDEYGILRECTSCKSGKQEIIKISRNALSFPKLLTVKLPRIANDKTIDKAKIEIDQFFEIDDTGYGLQSFIVICGNSLKDCRYGLVRRQGDFWLVKDSLRVT